MTSTKGNIVIWIRDTSEVFKVKVTTTGSIVYKTEAEPDSSVILLPRFQETTLRPVLGRV